MAHPHWVGVKVEVEEWERDVDELAPVLGLAQRGDPVALSEADTLPKVLTVELLEGQVVMVGEVQGLAWPLKVPFLDTLGVKLPCKEVREATRDKVARLGEPLPPSRECESMGLLEAVDPRVFEFLGDKEGVRVMVADALVLGDRDPEVESLALAEGL